MSRNWPNTPAPNSHEVLLQTPMEPFDYPDNDPGPQTLLTSLTPAQNIDRLHWLMSRFQGYVGIDSFMGARFTATEPALTPVLHDTAKRGLIFVDGSGSTAASPARSPAARTCRSPRPISFSTRCRRRSRSIARSPGSSSSRAKAAPPSAFATAQPGTIERIAEWAKKVETRGFVLVPITMVAVKAKSS